MLFDLGQCLEDYFQPRVEKGAVYLDEKYAGWIDQISTEDLNMMTSCGCICGQLFRHWSNRPMDLADKGTEFGFHLWEDEDSLFYNVGAENPAWKVLDRLWLDEINWRKS